MELIIIALIAVEVVIVSQVYLATLNPLFIFPTGIDSRWTRTLGHVGW